MLMIKYCKSLQKLLQTFANFWSIYFILFYFILHVRATLFLRQAERGSRPTRRHPRDNPVGEDVGVGVVDCGLYGLNRRPASCGLRLTTCDRRRYTTVHYAQVRLYR